MGLLIALFRANLRVFGTKPAVVQIPSQHADQWMPEMSVGSEVSHAPIVTRDVRCHSTRSPKPNGVAVQPSLQ